MNQQSDKWQQGESVAVSTKIAASYIGLTERFLEDRRIRGGGPKYVRVSARCILYRKEDLDAWLAERIYASTAEESVQNGK